MNDCKLFLESVIYFSDHALDDVQPEGSLYLSVFKSRMSELNEFIGKNSIIIQTLTHEQKIFLHKNLEHLKDQSESPQARDVIEKISSYILDYLKSESASRADRSLSLQTVSDTQSLEAFIQVTLEKNAIHIHEVGESLLSMPKQLIPLDRALLNRFVLMLAKVNPALVLRNLKALCVADPIVHEQIAMIALQKIPGWLCAYVRELNLSTDTLEKIAKEAASVAPSALTAHIRQFNIENSSVREEIAAMIIQKEPHLLTESILDFHITNEKARRDLAARISEKNPALLAHTIQKFELNNDLDIEVSFAKLAEIDPDLISEYFKLSPNAFGSVIDQIGLFVAREKPSLLIRYIEIFQITNEFILESFFSEAAKSAPKYFLENFHEFGIRDRDFFAKVIVNMAIAHPDFTFDHLEQFVASPPELPQFLATILEGYIQFYLSLAKDSLAFSPKDAGKFVGLWGKTASTLANTSKYRNTAVSVYLAKTFCDMFINSEFFKDNMLQLNGGALIVYKIRPSILPAKWISELKEERNNLSQEISMITKFLNKRKRDFCEASPSNLSASLLHNYLLTARTLDSTSLPPEKKIALFSRVFEDEEASNADICQKLILLNILISKNVGIETIHWKSKEDMTEILNASIRNGSLGNLEDIEDLSNAYANTFGALRTPYALEIFGACIQQVCAAEPLVRDAFEWFVHSVLKGTFQEERYKTDHNPHLKHIDSYDPALLKTWRKSLDFTGQSRESFHENQGLEIVETDDYQDLLFSGTEVSGSCLRIDGEAPKSKCLLSYLMDGKTRILAIKNRETGKLVSRTILRLLWDTKNNRPVLFQDFIYPAVNDPMIEKTLREASIAKAKSLNIPLLTSWGGDAAIYKGNATSLGSSCPYEYVDSAGGVTEGDYSIQHSQVLFMPI